MNGKHICQGQFTKEFIFYTKKKYELIVEEYNIFESLAVISKYLGIDINVWCNPKYTVARIVGRMSSFIFWNKPKIISINTEKKSNIYDIWAARKLVNMGIFEKPIKIERSGRHVSWKYKILRMPKEDEIGFSYTSEIIRKDLNIKTKNKYTRYKMSLYLMNDGKCSLCNLYFPFVNTTVDHIIPKTKGGGNKIENLQISCKSCNKLKSHMSMKEFRMKYSIKCLREYGSKNRENILKNKKFKQNEYDSNIISKYKILQKL